MYATPHHAATAGELLPELPRGHDERFTGFGIMGLPLASGYYLALRRWTATTIGPPYRAVYLRDPDGAWTIQTDAPPQCSCPRYLSSAAAHIPPPHPITLEWEDDWTLHVAIGDEFDWHIGLGDSAAAHLMRACGAAMPAAGWESAATLATMGAMAGPLMHAGRVRLRGTAPNGQWFRVAPTQVWTITGSTATWRGRDLGHPAPLREQTHLADIWLPQTGIFYSGTCVFERLDPARHAVVSDTATTAPPR